MRLAHFSDPHLLDLSGARVRDFLSKRWLGGLNLIASRGRRHKVDVFQAMVAELNENGVDHVLCTGDVTNVAIDCEFSYARRLFDELRQGPLGVTVIPGNHDVYVAQGMDYFRSYFGAFSTTDPGWEWPDGASWPTVRVRDGVAVIGVCTSLATPWFQAWGEVGEAQLARLRKVLTDERLGNMFRLVALHHPPAGRRAANKTRGLRDHEAFARVVAEAGAELVLHGHEHVDLRETLGGPSGDVAVRGIQSSTYDGNSEKTQARYRIYEIAANDAGRPSLVGEELRVWRREREAFVKDTTPLVAASATP